MNQGFLECQKAFEHCSHESGQIKATSAEVTPNGGLAGESPPKFPYFRFRNHSNLPRRFFIKTRHRLVLRNPFKDTKLLLKRLFQGQPSVQPPCLTYPGS